MSSMSVKNLVNQADAVTIAGIAMVVIDFLLVQTHFMTMLKHDPYVAQSKWIKFWSILSMFAEVLVLAPLFFMNSTDDISLLAKIGVLFAFFLVNLSSYIISLIKTRILHDRMALEGRIPAYHKLLRTATILVVVGCVGSFFLGGFGTLLNNIGFCMFLHVMNVLRRNNAAREASRMFWAHLTSILMLVVWVGVAALMLNKISSENQEIFMGDSDSGDQIGTASPSSSAESLDSDQWASLGPYFIALMVITVIWKFVTLITTGHFIGDSCGQRSQYLNFSNNVEHSKAELEWTGETTSGTEI